MIVPIVLITVLLSGLASAQSDPPKLTARELFYVNDVKKPAAAKSAVKPLGLRYSIQRETPGGAFAEVDPDTVFRTGNRLKLTFESNESGYLYIVQRGASGKWDVLFPPEQDAGGNRIDANQRLQIPQGTAFNVIPPAGDEKLFVILSRQREMDWDRLIRSVGGKPAGVDDATVDRAKQTVAARDLVYEKVTSKESAVYVVNVSPTAGDRVPVEITLKHQ
jgi:hypothetical protein